MMKIRIDKVKVKEFLKLVNLETYGYMTFRKIVVGNVAFERKAPEQPIDLEVKKILVDVASSTAYLIR